MKRGLSAFIGRISQQLRHGSEPGAVPIWEGDSQFGECPVWDAGKQTIYWLDIPTGALRARSSVDAKVSQWSLGAPTAGLALQPDAAGLLFGQGIAIHRFDPASGSVTPFDELPAGASGERINDMKYDVSGNLWVATMDSAGQRPTGRLFRRTPAGAWHLQMQSLPIFNGPAFAADGTTGYVCDTVGRRVLRFVVPAGESAERLRTDVFATFAEADGFPDGICVDAQAHLWVAHYAGGCVTRWSPGGEVVQQLALPARNVTSVAICDNGLAITTAASDNKKSHDAGGALFLHERTW